MAADKKDQTVEFTLHYRDGMMERFTTITLMAKEMKTKTLVDYAICPINVGHAEDSAGKKAHRAYIQDDGDKTVYVSSSDFSKTLEEAGLANGNHLTFRLDTVDSI